VNSGNWIQETSPKDNGMVKLCKKAPSFRRVRLPLHWKARPDDRSDGGGAEVVFNAKGHQLQ